MHDYKYVAKAIMNINRYLIITDSSDSKTLMADLLEYHLQLF